MLRRQWASRDAAGLHAAELMSVAHTAPDLVDERAHRDAHWGLHQPDVLQRSLHSHHLGAGACGRPDLREPLTTLVDDGGDVGESLRVVEDGGTFPQTLLNRARWLGARLTAHTHDGVHQRRPLAADVGAAASPHSHLDVLTATENVLADETQPFSVGNRFPEPLDGQWIFAADVVVCPLGAADDAGDEHAFKDLVRITFVDAAILVDVWLTFVRINRDELGAGSRLAPALPLDACRESRATAAAQPGGGHLGHGVLGRHLEEHLAQRAVSAAGDGILDGVGVDDSEILHDDPNLMLEEGVLVERRDVAECLRPTHATSPVPQAAGHEGGDVFRGNPAVNDRRLAWSLDLDGRLHPHGAVPADLTNDGVCATEGFATGSEHAGCALGFRRAVHADTHDELFTLPQRVPALPGGLLKPLEVGAGLESIGHGCSQRRPDDARPANCHRRRLRRG